MYGDPQKAIEALSAANVKIDSQTYGTAIAASAAAIGFMGGKISVKGLGTFKSFKALKNLESEINVIKGLESRGIRPQPGTRIKPDGIPDNWRIRPSKSKGGVKYSDPTNPRRNVRVEQGVPDPPHSNSRVPHVRDMNNGRYADKHGNPVQGGRRDPLGHISLDEYRYRP